jgi:hypothetical protein
MNKKIFISFLCLLFLFSCGIKADPEYKASKNKSIIIKVQ